MHNKFIGVVVLLVNITITFPVIASQSNNDQSISSTHIHGRIIKADGSPCVKLPYGWYSPNEPDDHAYLKLITDQNGGFSLSKLPLEKISIWVEVTPNFVQVWPDIIPGDNDLLLKLDPNKYIELAPDWRNYPAQIRNRLEEMERINDIKKISFTIPDLNGNKVSLPSDMFHDKVILINIFGSWCGSCLLEIPHLVNLKKKYQNQDFEIIGIAFEGETDASAKSAIRECIKKYNINYPILFGGLVEEENVMSSLKGLTYFRGYPTNIFIGRSSNVEDVILGFASGTDKRVEWSVAKLDKTLERILNQSKKVESMSPEEVSAQIEDLRKFIIPPKGASKADIDVVFGVPKEIEGPPTKGSASDYPMHEYQLLAPEQGQYIRAFLYVTYKEDKVTFIGINHLCVTKNRITYLQGSPQQIKQQQVIERENVQVLKDLIEIQKKYENKLKDASWNK